MAAGRLIGEVADGLGVNPKTIRYYESIGLIPPLSRNRSGYRVFTVDDVERLAFILKAKSLDFSLDDIAEILEVSERGERPCGYVTGLIEEKLREIEARMRSLRELRSALKGLTERREAMAYRFERDCICRMIEAK